MIEFLKKYIHIIKYNAHTSKHYLILNRNFFTLKMKKAQIASEGFTLIIYIYSKSLECLGMKNTMMIGE